MRTTAAVSVTALDRAHTGLYCSVCGPVSIGTGPVNRDSARAAVTAHMNAEHRENR